MDLLPYLHYVRGKRLYLRGEVLVLRYHVFFCNLKKPPYIREALLKQPQAPPQSAYVACHAAEIRRFWLLPMPEFQDSFALFRRRRQSWLLHWHFIEFPHANYLNFVICNNLSNPFQSCKLSL